MGVFTNGIVLLTDFYDYKLNEEDTEYDWFLVRKSKSLKWTLKYWGYA